MSTDPKTSSGPPPVEVVRATVSTAVRHRLQTVFEHAQRCVEKGDFDYANDLFTQCVVEDPGNLIYLQHFLGNLAKKHGGNKRGSRFSGLKIKSTRSALGKAIEGRQWQAAFQAGCDALRRSPWDIGTLVLMAKACGQMAHHECQLYYLRWALDVDAKDPLVNRELALALEGLGQFDQAIACWQRVAQSKPADPESAKKISQLSVDKTIHQGGYSHGTGSNEGDEAADLVWTSGAVANAAIGSASAPSAQADDLDEEKRLLDAIAEQPAEIENYVALAELYGRHDRLPNVELVLTKALSASGGALRIRELLEDAQLRRIRQQVDIARARAERDATDEAQKLAERMAAQGNQAELEIFAARSSREPANLTLQFELGMRLKLAGKYREAIPVFQTARDDPRRRATVEIHLGECFQHIRQFKLAANSYASSAEACGASDDDTKKLALYRAGVLCMELGDLDRAEAHLTDLAASDFAYRDVADRLDKLASMRENS
jgi:tetratricopeptide (TPR) repeat protein